MSFNAQEYLETYRPPIFVDVDGKEYEGRVLSHEQWLPFEQRFHALGEGEADYSEVRGLVSDLTRAMFPRGWRFWRRSVRSRLLHMPPMAWLHALAHFRQAQARHYGLPISPTGLGPLDHVGERQDTPPST